MFRYLLVLVVVSAVVYAAVRIIHNMRHACPSCHGRGWYEGVRMKETCRKCGGSGKLDPRLH